MFSFYINYLSFSFFIGLYRQRLEDAHYEGNIDEMIKSLPAYLSDRALDLGGGRSISSRIKRFKKCKYRSKK